ncbi:MAG: hypothetical protein INR64_02510 [Caulobacteraceae bacterium]|nr:hypothetical protein [Caulobacter sp.]
MRGVFDGIGDNSLGGWAFREGAGPLSVVLHHGETRLIETLANLPRTDIEEAFGVLACGFSFSMPTVLNALQAAGGDTAVPLRVTAGGVELAGATTPCTAADAADAAALAWFRHIRTSSPNPVEHV